MFLHNYIIFSKIQILQMHKFKIKSIKKIQNKFHKIFIILRDGKTIRIKYLKKKKFHYLKNVKNNNVIHIIDISGIRKEKDSRILGKKTFS